MFWHVACSGYSRAILRAMLSLCRSVPSWCVRGIAVFAAVSGVAWSPPVSGAGFPDCPNQGGYCIATGGSQFTYFEIGKNISEIVAPSVGVSLVPIEAAGSVENVERMRYQNGVKLAIVQSDVLQHYGQLARQGNRDAKESIAPLRVVLPLYAEEIHILTRVPQGTPDGGLHYMHDLKDKRIAVGSRNSGSAMTAVLAYRAMFGTLPADGQLFFSSQDDALRALSSGAVDAFFMVTGQPASRFDMASNAGRFYRFLALDPGHPSSKALLDLGYDRATIRRDAYKWLTDDVPTLAVRSYLISQVYTNAETRRNIANLTRGLCRKLDELRLHGHPKWNEVAISRAPLAGGWQYSGDALEALNSPDCAAARAGAGQPAPGAKSSCSEAERVLKLC